MRRELLESLKVLGGGSLVGQRDDGVTKETTDHCEVLGGLGCGRKARSGAGSGREDVGSTHAFGPRRGAADMEDLERDAKAEGGLAGKPEGERMPRRMAWTPT